MKQTFKILLLGIALLIAAPSVRILISGSKFLSEAEVPEFKTYSNHSTLFSAQFKARTSAASNTLKQIGLGLHNHHDVNRRLPIGTTFDEDGRAMQSWLAESSIMIGNVYIDGMNRDEPWDSAENARYFRSVVPGFLNPLLSNAPAFDARGFAVTHYAANQNVIGPNLGMHVDEITDGTEHTLLVGEVESLFQAWGGPNNWRDPALGINTNPRGFGSHPDLNGVHFLFADGHVQHISNDVDPAVLKALATPAAGD